jgi:ketosteroid isomerase-like protein
MAHQPEWIEGLLASIDGMDADTFVSYLTDDAIFRYGSNPPTEGKKAVHQYVANFFTMFKALRHTPLGVWAHPDAVFVQGEVEYTRHDGATIAVPFLNCLKMQDDKVKEYLIYIDPTPLAG